MELFLDLLLEVDQLEFYLWIDVSLLFQRPTRQSYDVTLGCALLAPHVLLSIRDALTHAVHVVRLSQSMLPRGCLLLICI